MSNKTPPPGYDDKSNDVEMIGFVERNRWVVLQSSDAFEAKTTQEKLNFIDYCNKSLKALQTQIYLGNVGKPKNG